MGDQDKDNQALVDWLGDHDESCPACTYSLAGLVEARCPECGAPARADGGVASCQPGSVGAAHAVFAILLFAYTA